MSYDIDPSTDMAEKIDPTYDDWFFVRDINEFVSKIYNLLYQQINLSDLVIDDINNIESIKRIGIKYIHKPVLYQSREIDVSSEDALNEARLLGKNPIETVFIKDENHAITTEYRIIFVVHDKFNDVIAVKPNKKILKAFPDTYTSECDNT